MDFLLRKDVMGPDEKVLSTYQRLEWWLISSLDWTENHPNLTDQFGLVPKDAGQVSNSIKLETVDFRSGSDFRDRTDHSDQTDYLFLIF